MNSYRQDIKNQSRELLIEKAILSLTTNRDESYLIDKSSFQKMAYHFNKLFLDAINDDYPDIKVELDKNFMDTCNRWLELYNSVCKSKSVKDLRVLYLSGPEPINDIDILRKHGISLHNIWAIESDKKNYNKALESLKGANIQIKLHRGSLSEFFELTNHEFDIIYFDACSSLISRQNSPVDVIKQIFANKRLSSLSALITNFSEPKLNNSWPELMACWYSLKYEFEVPPVDLECSIDPALRAEDIEGYSSYIAAHLFEYYDFFLTHFIPRLGSEIIPFWQITSLASVQSNYFINEQMLPKILNEIKKEEIEFTSIENLLTEIPHYYLALDAYPLLNWARLTNKYLDKDHPLIKFLKTKRRNISVEDSLYVMTLLKSYEESATGFKTFILDVCSEELKKILSTLDFFDRELRLTCDLPMKNLLVDLLVGLYGFPYIANAGNSLGLKYKAKETWMFSNVFIFDQCRYLYDFLPAIDLFEDFFSDISNQIVVRACMDTIHRRHFEYNRDLFKWSFIEDLHGEFGYSELSARINLNEIV